MKKFSNGIAIGIPRPMVFEIVILMIIKLNYSISPTSQVTLREPVKISSSETVGLSSRIHISKSMRPRSNLVSRLYLII